MTELGALTADELELMLGILHAVENGDKVMLVANQKRALQVLAAKIEHARREAAKRD
ncbi:MAG TPA: hypothetical protein VGO53_16330 [Steroidobacteraceae bacterium]|jgi:hypothetical protein|nr:hypothetical protein [Steroidobacteraceae bacterium]